MALASEHFREVYTKGLHAQEHLTGFGTGMGTFWRVRTNGESGVWTAAARTSFLASEGH